MSSSIKMSILLFSFAFVSVLSVNTDSEKTDVYVKQNNVSDGKPVEYKIEEFNITEPLFIIIPKDHNESFIGPPENNNTNRKLLEDIDENDKSENRRLLIKVANPSSSKTSSPVLKPAPVVVKQLEIKTTKLNGIKIYGNFCGPNYCGGKKFKGAEGPNCLWGVSPKDSLDGCCKVHDKCCGYPETRGTNCNKEILSCVKDVKCSDSKCKLSKAIIKTTFATIKNKVCGDIFGGKEENKSTASKVEVGVQKASVSQLKTKQSSSSTVKTTPKVEVVIQKNTIPKSVKENPTNSFSSETSAKNSLISPEKAKDEIDDNIYKTNKNLDKFKERIISFMTEIEHNEKDVELRNQNNYNDVKSSIEHEESRLEESRQLLKTLYNETESLNITIQTHYKKLISDTEYLKTLDLMRPAFLKSLDEISSHIEAVKNVVDQKLIKDEYKDEMLSLLTGIHFDTHNISGYVATAFINHYNKFKNSIQIEDTTYLTEMKKLTLLSNKYKEQEYQISELEKERIRLENILEKLKKTLLLSESQKKEFNIMFNEIISLFNGIQNRCN